MSINVSNGKYVNRAMVPGVDPDASGTIDAANDTLIADVRDLDDVTVYVNCLTFAGTATIHVDVSPDGVNWLLDYASSISNSSFAQAAQAVQIASLSDSHGMPQPIAQVRLRCTALTGGVYGGSVSGRQTQNYR